MSAKNTLRLLTAALVGKEQVPALATETLKFVPQVDDSLLELGDGTTSIDVNVYGNTASDYMAWDASAGKLTFTGAAVLNIPATQMQLDGVALTGTVAQINRATSPATRIVNTTATLLTISAANHGSKIVTINSSSPIAITLAQATGSGEIYRFFIGVVATATQHTIKVANATDVMRGFSHIVQTDVTKVDGFLSTATDDTITLNGTTTGGLVGDFIEIIDVATGIFSVKILGAATGAVATPFSATV